MSQLWYVYYDAAVLKKIEQHFFAIHQKTRSRIAAILRCQQNVHVAIRRISGSDLPCKERTCASTWSTFWRRPTVSLRKHQTKRLLTNGNDRFIRETACPVLLLESIVARVARLLKSLHRSNCLTSCLAITLICLYVKG